VRRRSCWNGESDASTSLAFFTVWALLGWIVSVAPVLMLFEQRSPLSALAEGFRLGKTFTSELVEIGMVMGIVNLAVDDSAKSHTGAQVDDVRHRQHSRRRALQKVGTRSAKRALRRASGRQARFQRHTNHILSQAIVADAEREVRFSPLHRSLVPQPHG